MVTFFRGRTANTMIAMLALSTFRVRFHRNFILILFCAAAISGAAAQTVPPSTLAPPPPTSSSDKPVAAAVRDSKAQKTPHAKRVFTNEDMDANIGPLPPLKMDGIDNSDQVIAGIGEYRKKHTPEQIEQAVRDWYDEYDSQLAAAIQDNQNRSVLMQENQANGYDLCRQGGDYEKCANRQMAEAVGARNDQTVIARNNALIHRLQNAFMKIRNGSCNTIFATTGSKSARLIISTAYERAFGIHGESAGRTEDLTPRVIPTRHNQ